MSAAAIPAPPGAGGRTRARQSLRDGLVDRFPGAATALDAEYAHAVAVRACGADQCVRGVETRDVWLVDGGLVALRYAVDVRARDGATSRRVLLADLPAGATEPIVRPFPLDPRLPTLAAAASRSTAPTLLREALDSSGWQDAPVTTCTVEVVHHPRVGPCVLRYEVAGSAPAAGAPRSRTVYAKVHADGSAAARADRAMRAVESPDGVVGGRLRLPRPMGCHERAALTLIEAIDGEPRLPALLAAAVRDAVERRSGAAASWSQLLHHVARAGRGLAALHEWEPPAMTALQTVSFLDELTAVRAEADVVRSIWPDVAAGILAALAGVAEEPESGPLTPRVAHGDFTPGQVLYADDRVGFVDLEGVCRADPAADVGRFLAYLEVAAARHGGTSRPLLASEARAAFLAGYVDGSTLVEPRAERLEARRTLTLARMALHACRALKDRRLDIALQLLARTDADPDRPQGRPWTPR